ncbi:MAG: hypothetical protein H6Q25_648 [Bacteroidetes bacterium]|nr:hypothetical protein [Bacteroidota bacterium]
MKSKIILLVLFTSMLFSLQAQYESFFGDSLTKYSIVSQMTMKNGTIAPKDHDPYLIGMCVATIEFYIFSSDTISFGNQVYHYSGIQPEGGEDGYLIREEVNTGKMYRYFPSCGMEILLCDMSLNPGDTFQLFPPSAIPEVWWSGYPEAGSTLIVDSVSYENGKKVIWFPQINESSFFFNTSEQYVQYDVRLKFIEGIGSTYGPFGYLQRFMEPYLPLVLCIEKDGVQDFMLNEHLGCYQVGVGIDENQSSTIHVYPNPTADQITLKSDPLFSEQTSVKIYNSLGLLVYSDFYESGKSIDVSAFTNGIYIIIIQDDAQKFINKFVKVK